MSKKDKNQQVIEELQAQLARALADYDNLRKRSEDESLQVYRNAAVKMAVRLLPVMDMLENAQGYLKDQGLAIAISAFEQIFSEEGIERMNIKPGDDFKEELGEVTEVVDNKGEKSNKIAQVVLAGWRLKDGRVIRHAKVKVNK